MFVSIVPNLLSWSFFVKSAEETNANKERRGVSLGWRAGRGKAAQKWQRSEAERSSRVCFWKWTLIDLMVPCGRARPVCLCRPRARHTADLLPN